MIQTALGCIVCPHPDNSIGERFAATSISNTLQGIASIVSAETLIDPVGLGGGHFD
jgi:hypothetical protein